MSTRALFKNLSARGFWGDQQPTISPKLINLGNRNLVCWLAFTDKYSATCIIFFLLEASRV